MAELYVDLKPQDQWRRKISKEALIEEMNRAVEELPGMNPSFSQPIRDNVLESISQIDGQIVVKLFSPDPEVLRNKTKAALVALALGVATAAQFVPSLSSHADAAVALSPTVVAILAIACAAAYW